MTRSISPAYTTPDLLQHNAALFPECMHADVEFAKAKKKKGKPKGATEPAAVAAG